MSGVEGPWPIVFAREMHHAHDPANQDHSYDRCALCGFTSHPCDTYDLAVELVKAGELVERLARIDVRGAPFGADLSLGWLVRDARRWGANR